MTEDVALALTEAPRGSSLCLRIAEQVDPKVKALRAKGASQLDGKSRTTELTDALRVVDLNLVALLGDVTEYEDAIADSISEAQYWQGPSERVELLRDPRVQAALLPIAQTVLSRVGSLKWLQPVNFSDLRYTAKLAVGMEVPGPPPLVGARERLHSWRADTVAEDMHAGVERPSDPRVNWTGRWWSTPALSGLVSTSSPLRGYPSAALLWGEDDAEFERAALWKVSAQAKPRVYEIASSADWASLVRRYPLEVTASRRHDWFRTTGVDSRWLIPDYSAVANDWDGVHLTVAGYLLGATRRIPVGVDAATVLAGWAPDCTWWLADVLAISGPPTFWRRAD